MSKLSRILLGVLAVVVIGAVVYLVTFDLPPPSTRVEKVIPDDRFKQ
jgi:hypothetical protein